MHGFQEDVRQLLKTEKSLAQRKKLWRKHGKIIHSTKEAEAIE